nr:hypothetical protein GCM10010200_041970 [Actinomadura rugatobispora]
MVDRPSPSPGVVETVRPGIGSTGTTGSGGSPGGGVSGGMAGAGDTGASGRLSPGPGLFGSTCRGARGLGFDRSEDRGAWRAFGFERVLGAEDRGSEERGGRADPCSLRGGDGAFTGGIQ